MNSWLNLDPPHCIHLLDFLIVFPCLAHWLVWLTCLEWDYWKQHTIDIKVHITLTFYVYQNILKQFKTYDMIQGIYNTHITYFHVHGGMDHSDLSFSRHLSKDFSKGRSAGADLRLLWDQCRVAFLGAAPIFHVEPQLLFLDVGLPVPSTAEQRSSPMDYMISRVYLISIHSNTFRKIWYNGYIMDI